MSFLFEEPVEALGLSLSFNAPIDDDALVFAFDARNDLIVIKADSSLLTVALAREHGLIDGAPSLISLGTLAGRAAHILLSDAPLPDPLRGSNLRRLFGALDLPMLATASLAGQLAHFYRNNRFCGRCAMPTTRSATDRALRCEPCGREIYPTIAPCIIVLVHDGDRILMTRTRQFPKGFYGLVAGFLEPGESLEQCAAREIREETGLEIEELRYVTSQPWPFPSQVMVAFTARYRSGELVVDTNELEDARWFELDPLPPLPPPFSVARHLIDLHLAARQARGANAP